MKKRAGLLITAGTFLLASGSCLAHHSMSMFDFEQQITYEGVVREWQYTNPHSWLIVDVTNEDGTMTTWGFETGSPSGLRRRHGIRPREFPPGMKVTIIGNPMKDGRHAGHLLAVTKEDGTEFILRPDFLLEGLRY